MSATLGPDPDTVAVRDPATTDVPDDPGDGLVARLRAAGCVFAEDEADLLRTSAGSPAELAALTRRRVAGEPVEQVVGWAGFGGLRISLAPGVFVPRRRSALLVHHAVDTLAGRPPGAVVVDLCCGSGAVGAAVAAAVPGVRLHAADVDPAAVACARANVPPGAPVHLGDLDAPLPRDLAGRVDVLLAVVPYVPTDAIGGMPREAREHEPRAALDGGRDGLDVLRRVTAAAPTWLAPDGVLLLEIAAEQAGAARCAVRAAGLRDRVEQDDEIGATIVVGARVLL